MHPLAKIRQRLNELDEQGLLRQRWGGAADPGTVDVCSNDYLGYGRRVVSRETIASAGAGASRLVLGTQPAHEALERELSAWVGLEQSLLFSSGYAANTGVLGCLGSPDHVIISDELNHASIVDGCRLSRARIAVVPHLDAGAVERALAEVEPAQSAWVVTESLFSMDGDTPDLPRLRAACDRHGAALYVDEAHALGVLGPEGGGLCRATNVRPDVLVGTLGKAVGVHGAFVAGESALLDFIWNRARSFVFSTAGSPLLAEVALANVRRVRNDEAGRNRLAALAKRLREQLGLPLPPTPGPIIPVVLGTPARALAAADHLRARGFAAVAIRPPTVPAGKSRLRISLRADLTDEQLAGLAAALRECLAS